MIRNKNKTQECEESDLSVTLENPSIGETNSSNYTNFSLLSSTSNSGTLVISLETSTGIPLGYFSLPSGGELTVSDLVYTPAATPLANPLAIFADVNHELTSTIEEFSNNSYLQISKWNVLTEAGLTPDPELEIIITFSYENCNDSFSLLTTELWSPQGEIKSIRSISFGVGAWKTPVYGKPDNLHFTILGSSPSDIAGYVSTFDTIKVYAYEDGQPDIILAEIDPNDLFLHNMQSSNTGLYSASYYDNTQFVPTHKAPNPTAGLTAAQLAWDNISAPAPAICACPNGANGDVSGNSSIFSRYFVAFGYPDGGIKVVITFNNGNNDVVNKLLTYGTDAGGNGRGAKGIVTQLALTWCTQAFTGYLIPFYYTPYSQTGLFNASTTWEYKAYIAGVEIYNSGIVQASNVCGDYGTDGLAHIGASSATYWASKGLKIPSTWTPTGTTTEVVLEYKLYANGVDLTYEDSKTIYITKEITY